MKMNNEKKREIPHFKLTIFPIVLCISIIGSGFSVQNKAGNNTKQRMRNVSVKTCKTEYPLNDLYYVYRLEETPVKPSLCYKRDMREEDLHTIDLREFGLFYNKYQESFHLIEEDHSVALEGVEKMDGYFSVETGELIVPKTYEKAKYQVEEAYCYVSYKEETKETSLSIETLEKEPKVKKLEAKFK